MADDGTSSELVRLNSSEIESARHILSVLTRQGCPARLLEVASESAVSQNLLKILCRIPGFPLTFTSDGAIGASDVMCGAFVELMIGADALRVPRDALRISGLRRGGCSVSMTYARKRKAQTLGKAVELLQNSKRRSFLTHRRGEGDPLENKGVPMLLSSSNEIPRKVSFDVTSPSKNEQHSIGIGTLDYCTVGLDQEYDFSMPFHDANYFDFENISCVKEEDAMASAPCVTNSVSPRRKVVDFSGDIGCHDVWLDTNIIKEHAFRRSDVVEYDFRHLLNRMLDKPSLVNQSLREDCNTLSLELGSFTGIPEAHALERLKIIEKELKASLMERETVLQVNQSLGEDFSTLSLELGSFSGIPDVLGLEKLNMTKNDSEASLMERERVLQPNQSLREDFSTLSLELGSFSSIPEVHGFEKTNMIEKDFEASLMERDRVLLVNQSLGEDCNTLSLELRSSSIPEVHAPKRIDVIEKDFAASLWGGIALNHIDHSSQNANLLAFGKQAVTEDIGEGKLHSKVDKFIISQLESNATMVASLPTHYYRKESTTTTTYAFGDDAHNSSAIARLQSIAGPNFANDSTCSLKEHYKNIQYSSQQKLLPNSNLFIPEEEEGSGLNSRCRGTIFGTQRKDEGNIFAVKCEGERFPQLSFSNDIIKKVNVDVRSPSCNEQHSIDTDTLDCCTFGLNQAYDLPVPLNDMSYFNLRDISYNREEDTRESASPCITYSVVPHVKDVDHSEDVPLANMTKDHALQRLRVVEADFRPLLDRVVDQPSLVNQTSGKDCNTFSIELGFLSGVPEVHTPERLSMLERNSEEFLMERGWDETSMDNNTQNASLLVCRDQVVNEAIDERKVHSKNDTPLLTFPFGDGLKNSAAIEPATMDELADLSEEKQRTFNNSTIKDHIASVGLPYLFGSNFVSNSTSSTKDHEINVVVGLIPSQKVKDTCNVNMPSKENRIDAIAKASNAIKPNYSEQKLMPNFESFIIEEEEGSGGYGIVYKAQRKVDGKIFAVKCPHANAHSHHVHNELKMLERFGGRNFVIKYEGSFKNGDIQCFILEHVEHDRPEVLKKEIGLFELQWYGFCMFRALASLHKQGVVHRDVKPGNFLFSRNVNKGYLIDFNLASDLHQKFCRSSKRKMPSSSIIPISLQESKSSSSIRSRKVLDRHLSENAKKEAPNEFKKVSSSKSSKKKSHKDNVDGFPIVDRSKHGSQTADVSGLTSTKDQTSNKSLVDWLNQPMPCKGRKELINFVHKTIHSTQNMKSVSNVPSSQRKRIEAPMAPTNDTGLLILTPMPLHSGGNAVTGAGLKNNASGKVKREGPCVGTKGFRAPEVLFKSFHQGCKIDIWSAGVTMLYLMIGRAPFGGDPEQNIKEIARLRGSEDLWEVAKLHNCENSFPVDLLDVVALKSMKLKDWCAKNTRRPDFLEVIPESLFDLVDRCLTVNPRCRFSAEEALMHRFFAPCHDSIRKQRLLRKVASSELSSSIF